MFSPCRGCFSCSFIYLFIFFFQPNKIAKVNGERLNNVHRRGYRKNFPVSRFHPMFPRFFTTFPRFSLTKFFKVCKCERCGSLNPRLCPSICLDSAGQWLLGHSRTIISAEKVAIILKIIAKNICYKRKAAFVKSVVGAVPKKNLAYQKK